MDTFVDMYNTLRDMRKRQVRGTDPSPPFSTSAATDSLFTSLWCSWRTKC